MFFRTQSHINRANKILVSSLDYANNSDLIDMNLNNKLIELPNGVDVNLFKPNDTKVNSNIVLFVGGLDTAHWFKGVDVLIEAFSRVEIENKKLVIVGDGNLRPQLEAEIEALALADTVILCGAIPHNKVVEKYTQSAIFVLPCVLSKDGDRDGIPNVILEAMAMGLPVVSTQHSGIPEVVTDVEIGYLVSPEDVTNLAKSLAKLLDDTAMREQLGQNGRQTVVEKFAVEETVKRLYLEFVK